MSKIGVAVDPNQRMATIAVGHPHKLRLAYQSEPTIDARLYEARAHAILGDSRMAGEWFNVSAEMATQAIERAMGGPVDGDAFIRLLESPEIRRQRAYRARRTAKIAALEAGLTEIRETVEPRKGEVADKIRTIVDRCLSPLGGGGN